MDNSIYEEFRALADKKRLSAADKVKIEEVAQAYGLSLNKNCPDCYRDAATQIALANKPKVEQEQGEYELCDGIDITLDSFRFGRLHVCAKNCTPENARKWVEAGIPLRYFKRIPNEGNGAN